MTIIAILAIQAVDQQPLREVGSSGLWLRSSVISREERFLPTVLQVPQLAIQAEAQVEAFI